MTVKESAFLFACGDEELVGIVAEPRSPQGDVGVLVVVGGPQYRVGSHRQFVLLARHLAEQGIPCMRFDYRGMGDATGAARDFESVADDIRAALDAFLARVPSVGRVVLWGLCDGASAACFYAPTDMRVAGLVLLNPWVKTAQGEARTYLKHYYLRRLLDPYFWKKLLAGGISLGRSIGEVIGTAKMASSSAAERTQSLPDRMGTALQASGVRACIVLSGNDFVAREFESVTSQGIWARLLGAAAAIRLNEADHTFSSRRWRDEVARKTVEWVRGLR